jgi:hypothetical protein
MNPTWPEGCFAPAVAVADAVLYEGYLLYPYRASALKNRIRWQFGLLAPAPYAERDDSDPASMRAEVILRPDPAGGRTALWVWMRFLQVQSRRVERCEGAGALVAVDSLELDGQRWSSWEESVERSVELGPLYLDELGGEGQRHRVELSAGRDEEWLGADPATPEGRVLRLSEALSGEVTVRTEPTGSPDGAVRVAVEVHNRTPWAGPATDRDELARHCLVATHLLLGAPGARFASAIDPPEDLRAAVAACTHAGCFPVLAGADGVEDVMLVSPIILYDHPAVAPESKGDMYDATEIDEILALRVLTLTDEEKREAASTDPRAARIVARCETLSPDAFAGLHGAVRSLRPGGRPGPEAGAGQRVGAGVAWGSGDEAEAEGAVDPANDTVLVGTSTVRRGARVRLQPCRRADAQDMFLAGRSATVHAVLHDLDGAVHLAVVVDDDPAAELHEWYGRYLYFAPEELAVLEEAP